MRVAVAGTNGIAYWIAQYLRNNNGYQFIILSRSPKPHLKALGWQVVIVSYDNPLDLTFKLAGVDTVISMVTGNNQLALIHAALRAGVQHFAPAEFAGPLLPRTPVEDLDRGQQAALDLLRQLEPQGMRYTVFSCGILYERFSPGGIGLAGIGLSSGANDEGDYLVNIRNMTAAIPLTTTRQPATICLTSAEDVGRFIVAALDLPNLPTELRMRGERMDVAALVRIAEDRQFGRTFYTPEDLQPVLMYARYSQNETQVLQTLLLIATAEGKFDFEDANLNRMVAVTPKSFEEWLYHAWAGQLV